MANGFIDKDGNSIAPICDFCYRYASEFCKNCPYFSELLMQISDGLPLSSYITESKAKKILDEIFLEADLFKFIGLAYN